MSETARLPETFLRPAAGLALAPPGYLLPHPKTTGLKDSNGH
jgi:hypothetical protein